MLLLVAAAAPAPGQDDPAGRARRFVAEARRHPGSLDVPAARDALSALDAAGDVDSAEGRWLIDRLLEAEPGDTELLWLRARLRTAVGDLDGAIRDLEALVAASPPRDLLAAALRRLSRAYAEAGRPADQLRIDRILLDEKLEDEVPVLVRMAKAYRARGDLKSTRQVLDRLLLVAPDELRFNADLVWIAAEISARVDEPLAAGRRYLAFANLFPDDPRCVEALLEAARLMRKAGHPRGAMLIAGEAVERGGQGRLSEKALLLRAGIEEQIGEKQRARVDYYSVVAHTLDPALAADALRELVELSLAEDGLQPTLMMLAGLAIRGDGYCRTFAASHFVRLMRVSEDKLIHDDRDAAFYMTIAFEMGDPELLPAGVRLRAARFFGSLGDGRKVAEILGPLATRLGETGRRARELLAEHGLEVPLGGQTMSLVERAERLWRRRAWGELIELLDDTTLSREDSPRLRALRADAELRVGRPGTARRVLGPSPRTGPEKILLADAESLLGNWKKACAHYRAAAGDDLPRVERAWCEVRVAECEHREGRTSRSRQRLVRLMQADQPPGPACAARVAGIAWGLALPGEGTR